MPFWDFYCETCHVTFELTFPTVEDSENTRCPKCGSTATRQPSAPSFTVKGYNANNGYSGKG